MIKVGIIGFGFMGRMHYRCWKGIEDATVAAICDANAAALAPSAQVQGNIAGASDHVDLTGIALYGDMKKMFRKEKLDAVSITLPTFLHADCTLAALEASVHVLCEKPMALTPGEGARMMQAAERSGKVLQIGHCIRFWPEYAKAKEIVASGKYGRVIAASFQRFASTGRKGGTWFNNEQQSGGMPLDLHIHDTDFIQYLFGMPREVSSNGVALPDAGLTHMMTRYAYDDGKLVTAECGWGMTASYGFLMRFHILLEHAVLDFDFTRKPTLRLCPVDGPAIVPPLEDGDGYSRQIAHFTRKIRGEEIASVITPRESWNSLRLVEAERESVRTGSSVRIA